MPYCSAFGCNFQSKGNKSDVSIHRFPTDKKMRKTWENACGRTQLPKYPRLCSRHFSPDAFEDFSRPQLLKELMGADGYKRRLKPDAFPTIFPHKPTKRPREASEMRAKKRHRQEMLDALLSRQPAPAVAASVTLNKPSDTPLVKEEADNSPLQSASVTLQRSPNRSDTAIKTDPDPDTPDAAVQWPADVQRAVTMDHTYANKRGLDTREDSQPRHRSPHPEYNPPEYRLSLCSVLGCESLRRVVQRFKLPEDPERRLEWVQFLFEVNGQRLKESCWTDIMICSEHFTEDCFETPSPSGMLQLKPGVVPSLGPIKSELDDVEIPTCDSPDNAAVSVTVSISDEEGDPPDNNDDNDDEDDFDEEDDDDEEVKMSTDEEWTPTEEVLLAEELAEEAQASEETEEEEETSDDEEESDSQSGLKIKELCTECGSFFNRLKPHTCEHKIKPYSCDICGKRCVAEKSLKAHSRIHDETYEHPCKYCYVTFKTRVDKLKHETIHKENKDPYKCPDCPETFSTNKARNSHLSKHRGPPEYKCGVCGIEFTEVHHLRRHAVVHTGLRPYKCSVCQRDFSQMSHLKSHMRLHTGERPYKCQHCDKCFNHNVSLKSHVQRYHTSNSGFARRKGKTNKRASDNGDSNENRRGTDSEIDNMEEEQHTEEDVQEEGIALPKSKKRKTGRPRGRPKRGSDGKLLLSGQNKDQHSNPSKSSKLKSQKLKETGSSDEEGEDEQLDSNMSFDSEEEDEGQESQTVKNKSTGRSRRKPKNMTVTLIFTQNKKRCSRDNSTESSGKRRGRQRKETVA